MTIRNHLAQLRAAVVVVLAACTTAPQASPPQAGPTPAGPAPTAPASPAPREDPPPGCCDRAPHRDQPPELKLKLGHFANKRRGIGIVFDRSTEQAKLRFDGTTEIVQVDPASAGIDRTDYIRSLGHVVLQLWADGRVVVFVNGDEVDLVRDGDADPL
jgi:hypothetical protein